MPELLLKRQKRKAIVYCVDPPYLPYALFLASQIHFHEPQRDFDFCLISDQTLDIPDSLSYLNIRLYQPLNDPAYDRLLTTHLPRSAYLRMWAPLILSEDYDRILYLDSDMFAEGNGFSELFDVDLKGCAIGAVLDVQQWYRPNRLVKEFELAGRPAQPYFNSGVLLIDTAAYRHENILTRALEIEQTHPDWVRHHDQSLLNLATEGRWTQLSPLWNWQWPIKYPLFSDWLDIRLHHFIGGIKPWKDPNGIAPARYYLAYKAFFKAHFPYIKAPLQREFKELNETKRLLWLFLRFAVMRGKVMKYIKQFPDPYSTK